MHPEHFGSSRHGATGANHNPSDLLKMDILQALPGVFRIEQCTEVTNFD